MSSNSSGYRVRRQLSFQDVPYHGKLFYVDIKVPHLKQKITKRIYDLGGQVESFLSKDLNLILVDGDEQKKTATDFKKLQNIPLSRGQALLNASKDQKGDSNNNTNNDIIHRASLLGVKTQTVKEFIHASAKFISKIKSQKKEQQKEKDFLQGMSPIKWDKENFYIIKLEDNESIYRPLYKQFETAPKLAYNDKGSPFDVGVVLAKQNDRKESKKKTSKAPVKGGYCESCDHWFKSTLKEHLNSNKHRAFVSSVVNFKSLETVSAGLPDLKSFMSKFEPEGHTETETINDNNIIDDVFKSTDTTEIDCAISNLENDTFVFSSNHTEKSNHVQNLKEDISKFKFTENSCNKAISTGGNTLACDLSDTILNKKQEQLSNFKKQITLDTPSTNPFSDNFTNGNDKIHDNDATIKTLVGTVEKPCDSVKMNFDIFPGTLQNDDNNRNTTEVLSWTNPMQNKSKENTDYLQHTTFGKQCQLEANFSSSSCSFGDHGVNNVLTFLQSHGSGTGSGKQLSDRHSVETVLTDKSYNSKESCMIKGSVNSHRSLAADSLWMAPSSIEQFVKSSSEQGTGSALPVSVDNQCDSHTSYGIHENNERKQAFHHSISCDTLNFDQTLHVKSNPTSNPDYSNITEESVSSELPKVDTFKQERKDSCITPSKEESEALRNEMMKNVANSGATWSSIRNWLLPGDDLDKPADHSDHEMDITLVHEDGKKDDDIKTVNVKKDCDKHVANMLNENSAESSNNFVAAWIQNQKFEVPGESEHYHHSVSAENIQQVNTNCISKEKLDTVQCIDAVDSNNDKLLNVIESLAANVTSAAQEEGIGSINGNANNEYDDYSDCTSISDCTLENFKVGSTCSAAQIEPDVKKEHENKHETSSQRNWECMSQNSSLSCQMTAKGFKIKGLLGIKQNAEETAILDKAVINKTLTHNMPGADAASKTDLPSNSSSLITGLPEQSKQENVVKNDKRPVKSVAAITPLFVKDDQSRLAQQSLAFEKGQETSKHTDYIKGQLSCDASNTSNTVKTNAPLYQSGKAPEVKNSFSPQCRISQVQSTFMNTNMYSPISQTSQITGMDNSGSCMQNYINQTFQMAPSPLMGDSRYGSHPNFSTYSEKQHSGLNYSFNVGNQNMMNGDYFNTGMLPYETHCSGYRNDYSSFPSEFNQSYNSSSFYMNGTTDYLAMSSPRHDSVGPLNKTLSFTNVPQSSTCMNTSQNQQYQVSSLLGNCLETTTSSNVKSKPAAGKNKSRKTDKRKRKDGQFSFLSSSSSFNVTNQTPLSSCGFSSTVVEPANSLQSDWDQSSQQSAVSSVCLSTIRTEDIAEQNYDYSYSFNQPNVNTFKREKKISQKRKMSRSSNIVHPGQFVESSIVNSSTPNSQSYLSPHSAMYDHNSYNVNNFQNHSLLSQPNVSQVAPFSSPYHHTSYQCPSHLPQQISQYDTSQAHTTVNNTYNYPNNVPTYSQIHKPVSNEPHTKNNFNQNVVQGNMFQDQNGQTSQGHVYNAIQTGETRLRLRKIPFPQTQQQNDLKGYWNVRKAGDCRLVFSNPMGKRKADDTPYENCDSSGFDNNEDYQYAKKRRCLVY